MDIKTLLNNGFLTTIATLIVMAGYQTGLTTGKGLGLVILGGAIYVVIAVLNKHGIEVSGR